MYEKNVFLLEEKVKKHAFIRPVKEHINEDGSFDPTGYVELFDAAASDFEKIWLWEDSKDAMGPDASYMVLVPALDKNGNHIKDADTIIVAHGGGFGIRTGCEGPNVALEFNKRGYNTVILVYRLLPNSRHDSLKDYLKAVSILRARQKEFEISDKIIAMGFSAGAMLSGNVAVYGRDYEDYSDRVDLAVIGYGAMSCVSFPLPFMANVDLGLFGDSDEDRFYFATEKHVTPKTCPMFIWQTLSDDGRHGMALAKALQDAGVPYELHIFDGGVHGLALADGENDLLDEVPHINHWVDLCDEWIKMMLK